jgi:hypothetical protein
MKELKKPKCTVAERTKREAARIETLNAAVQWCKDNDSSAGKCLKLPQFKHLVKKTVQRRINGSKPGAGKGTSQRVLTDGEEVDFGHWLKAANVACRGKDRVSAETHIKSVLRLRVKLRKASGHR